MAVRQNVTLRDVKEVIKKYMILDPETEGMIDIILAVALSIESDRPVWIGLVAPPSSGKTELLGILDQLEEIHQIGNLTSKFLFSGYASAQGGYMPREVKERGVLLFPDLTTILSKPAHIRNEIFNQLRTIFDGKTSLGTGMDVGKINEWEGKVAVIACVTEAIERIKAINNDLGERFLYYKTNPPPVTTIITALSTGQCKAKADVRRLAGEFLRRRRKTVATMAISPEEDTFILNLAKFIAQGRAAVIRNGYSREIVQVQTPEQPHRVAHLLGSLYRSLKAIHDGNANVPQSLLKKVARDTIPADRLRILEIVGRSGSSTIATLTKALRISDTAVTRIVEDMVAQRMLADAPKVNGIERSIVLDEGFVPILRHVLDEVVIPPNCIKGISQ